jgi:glycosyltransferase involved in cell wall biosynthesis
MSESLHQRREGGKRTDWSAAKLPAEKPLITIITSTFNAVKDLPWTSDSLWGQTYPYIQWIVADGASIDGTVEWLTEHDELIDVWFSEPDSGIYDAWNKAVIYAQGDWIQFLGAGDELAAPDTLAALATTLVNAHPLHDLVYGKLRFLSEKNRIVLEELGEPWDKMRGRRQMYLPMLPMHPAIFAHKSLFSEPDPFDSHFRIAADALFLTQAISRKDPLFVDTLIDLMPLGGISGRLDSVAAISKEYWAISKKLGVKNTVTHIIIERTKLFSKLALFSCLPHAAVLNIADIYRKMSGRNSRWSVD